MHIKLVVPSFPKASETFLFNLVTGLEAQGVKVTVCALSKSDNQELYKTRINEWSGNIEIIPLETKLSNIFSVFKSIILNPSMAQRRVSRLGIKKGLSPLIKTIYLLKGKPDIIHFAYSGLGIVFLDAVKFIADKDIKIIVSCRGTAEKVKPITEPSRRDKLKELFNYADRIHCVSSDMLEGLTKYGLQREKAFVNYPSIDIDNFRRETPYNFSEKSKWELLTTGRLHYQKGYIYILLALKKLKDKGYNFTYNILGEGTDREMLLYIINELELENEVVLHGKVSSNEVKIFLGKADIFILSSLYEGVANAALEAMAMQIPIVATKAGGMAEVIQHGINGMIVNRFDYLEIAKAIEELFQSTDLRKSISTNAEKTIRDKFHLNNQIDIFKKEYIRLVSGN